MDARRVGFHPLHCIADDGQILIFNLDQLNSRGGFRFALGNDCRNLIANESDNIRAFL